MKKQLKKTCCSFCVIMLICLSMMGAAILRDPTMPANYTPPANTPITPQGTATPSVSPQTMPTTWASPIYPDIAAPNVAAPGVVTPGAVTEDTPAIIATHVFVITAIFGFPNHRIAVINDQHLKVGDKIDEFTITTITPYTVELRGPDNTSQVLNLLTQIKAPAPKQ